MLICDLDHLESMSGDAIEINGGATAAVGVWGYAQGTKFARSNAQTRAIAKGFPDGSSVAYGVGYVETAAYSPAPQK